MSKLIMVIDDSLTVRKILEVTLRREAIDVVSYPDGVEALRALKAQPDVTPALIFLDIQLPKLDGYAFARLLRTNPRFDSTVIIMLSRRDGLLDRLKGRLAGATVYMTKPFRKQDILSVVSQYLYSIPTLKAVGQKDAWYPQGAPLLWSVTTLPYRSVALQMRTTESLDRLA